MKSFYGLLLLLLILLIPPKLHADSYLQLKAGAGIAGGDDKMAGAAYDALRLRSNQGPAPGVNLGFAYMRTINSSSSWLISGNISLIYGVCMEDDDDYSDTGGETPPAMNEFPVLWHYDEFTVSYAYTFSKTISFAIGPHFMTGMGFGDYKYDEDNEGYPDSFFVMTYYAGGAAGVAGRFHLYRSVFFLPKLGSGFVAGRSFEKYDSETFNSNEYYGMLNGTLGFGHYVPRSATLIEYGVLSNFYLQHFYPTKFFDGVRYARIMAYTSFTRKL